MYKVIFSKGDWIIRDSEGSRGTYGCHTPCMDKQYTEYSWFVNDPKPVCTSCGAVVPEEIQALVMLMRY